MLKGFNNQGNNITSGKYSTTPETKDIAPEKPERRREKILISRAEPGMELAADVYTHGNQVILNAGSILDAQKISKIMFYSVDAITVYVNEEDTSEAPATFTEQLKSSVEFREFSVKYDSIVDSLKESIDMLAGNETKIDDEKIFGKINEMILGSGSNTGVFNMLHCIRDFDEVTFVHSVNVALICNCFGRWLGILGDELKVLTIAGLFHDFGKTMIPREIIMKPDTLTPDEYEIIKTHTLRGYNLLKRKELDDRVKLAALQHHERCDGSGYPFGRKGNEIEPFSMIVAIADVYDAMTCDRTYRPRLCPFEVIKSFEKDMGSKYDPKFMVPLLEQISQVYMNHTVKLTDGSVGTVIMTSRELTKPIVRVDDIFVDLTRKRDIAISEIL